MLQLKLNQLLKKHGISETALANAIADVVVDQRQPVSERHLRYLISNTEHLTHENKKRKPSLVMLGLIIRGLRRLTGEAVDITDVMEYVTDPYEAEGALPTLSSLNRDQTDATHQTQDEDEVRGGLVPVVERSEAYDLLDRIRDLTIQRLRARGFHDLETMFVAAVGDASRSGATMGQQHWSIHKWILMGVGVLLVVSIAVFAYDRFIVQPRLLAARGGIFAFRDRVKATSDLAIPTLIGPEGEVDQLEPVLRVSAVSGGLAYEFYVEDMVSGDGVYTGPLSNNAFPIPTGTLCPNTPYEWRVRVLGEDGWTSFSSALEFTVSADALNDSQQNLLRLAQIKERPTQPIMVSPLGLASSVTPTLEVEPAEDIMGYGFYIRDLQSDQVIYNNNFALTNEVEVPEGLLEEGGIYQWNTRARNCHYWSEFTPAQVFNVDVQGGK